MTDSQDSVSETYNIIITITGDEIEEETFVLNHAWDWSDLSEEEAEPPVPSFKKVGFRGELEIVWTKNMRRPRSFEEVETGEF